MEKSEIVYLVGLPGVGKSTYVSKYYKNYVIISNDGLVEEYAKKHGLSYNDAWGKVNFKDIKRNLKEKFNDAVKHNKNIVIDNTNLTVKSRKLYEADNYIKTAVVFSITDSEWNKRSEKRKIETGKVIPTDVIQNMIKLYQPITKDENFSKIIYVKN